VRRAARTDSNHTQIVSAFRKLGCSVLSLAALGKGCGDILVAKHGQTCMVEIKDGSKPKSGRKLTPDEVKFHQSWQGALFIVETLADVEHVYNLMWISSYVGEPKKDL